LTAPLNPFVVAIDDEATKCLNRYFDYAVEECLLKYEQGNTNSTHTIGFKSDRLANYGILPKEIKVEEIAEQNEDQTDEKDAGGDRRLLAEEKSPFSE